MKIKSCSWVLRRLPLLEGGELAVDERRRVERHLIGCPDCRTRRDSSVDALTALRSLAEVPARRDVASLWPVLERQIRQSRHFASRPAWSWSWLFARASPALSFGMAVGGVMAIGFALGRTAPASLPTESLPVVVGPVAAVEWTVPTPAVKATVPPKPRALPDTPKLATQPPSNAFQSPNIRVDYFLDHGYPMGSGARDPQRSY